MILVVPVPDTEVYGEKIKAWTEIPTLRKYPVLREAVMQVALHFAAGKLVYKQSAIEKAGVYLLQKALDLGRVVKCRK